jgi:hypothetical protein
MQKLFEKNLKYLYYNLPHYYKLISSFKSRRFLIKNNNIFDTFSNIYLYPNSIEKDSKIFATNPINNDLYTKHFTFINPQKWENNFYSYQLLQRLILTHLQSNLPYHPQKAPHLHSTILHLF